jgi:hypothetical protein
MASIEEKIKSKIFGIIAANAAKAKEDEEKEREGTPTADKTDKKSKKAIETEEFDPATV